MGREIKFRAWIDYKIGEPYMLYASLQNLIKNVGADIDCEEQDFNGAEHIMQFTGLLDKNGKEIYEGDIVKQYAGKAYETVMTVLWLADEFHTGWYLSQRLELGADRAKTLEVIGNIFQPPDEQPEF